MVRAGGARMRVVVGTRWGRAEARGWAGAVRVRSFLKKVPGREMFRPGPGTEHFPARPFFSEMEISARPRPGIGPF